MNPLSPTDLDDLYVHAQLVADDADEAAFLLNAALDARSRGDRNDADVLIRQLAGEDMNQRGAWLARRQVPAALEDMLPRLMARLRPSRRMAIVKAFRNPAEHDSDRSVFLISVKRALESDGMHSVSERLTLDALEESMRRYLDSQMAPIPDSIRETWEQSYHPPAEQSAFSRRRFPLSARIAAGVLIILLSAAIGSWITSPSTNTPVRQSELFDTLTGLDTDNPEFRSSDPEQIERFLADRLDWRLVVPTLQEGLVDGVSIVRLSSDLEFPVIHYNDQSSEDELRLFVIDYRFIEEARNAFLVDGRILDQIADTGGIDIRNAPDFFRVTWRFRDDIYIALSDTADPELRVRFRFD